MDKYQKGIAQLFLLVIVILAAIGAIGYLAYKNGQLKNQISEQIPTPGTTEVATTLSPEPTEFTTSPPSPTLKPSKNLHIIFLRVGKQRQIQPEHSK